MDNHDSHENLDHDARRHPNTHNNNIDVNSEKIISLDTNDVRVYDGDGADKTIRLTNISNNNSLLNPFAAALDIWQSYVSPWSNAYNQMFFSNPPMTNGEFWFMYYRFDSKSRKMDEK
jgi:hypothetical protein